MADINVLMVGGRRAGKTSLLAAVKACCDEKMLKQLTVSAVSGADSMNDKVKEMQDYFSEPQYKDKMFFEPDGSPSDNPSEYEFEVIVNQKNSSYTIGFTDVPGEYYGSNESGEFTEQEFEEIQSYIDDQVRNSQVFLIAIDTPHLMEKNDRTTGYGAGHEWFNRVNQITDLFKHAFQDAQNRMVLFVPIKCERYLDKMDKVAERVEAGYAELITYLTTGPVGELCTVTIAPIISLGGASFLRFQNNDWHYVGEYHYNLDPNKREYKPQNCEQPLMLILQYLLDTAKKQRNNQHVVIKWFQERILGQARLADLETCEKEIQSLVITDKKQGFVQLHPKREG